MFGISFKIALRYLWRNRTYTLLNFVCLTFGMTAALVAVLFIFNILSFDKFHKNYDRLFSAEAYVTYFNGDRFPKSYLSASLADQMKAEAPEIESTTRVAGCDFTFVNGEKTFREEGFYADGNFFELFSFPLLQNSGNPLADINSIVISESMAIRYFGSSDCLGKSLVIKEDDKTGIFKVTGLIRKIPRQSTLQFDFVIPFAKFLSRNDWAVDNSATACQTWTLLREGVAFKSVTGKIKNLINKLEPSLNQELFLFPLSEKELYGYAGGVRIWRGMQNVVLVGAIGLAILLIACFNFINLAIALNIRRYREAGIKKVMGSERSVIILQFLGEIFLVTFTSLASAVILVSLLLPGFNTLFNNDIHFELIDSNMILFFVAISLFTGLVSGLLPALYLASSNPVNVLKGKAATSHSYSKFRQSLIVFQFIIPIILIIGMMIIKTQDSYMRNYNVGVEKDKLIVLPNLPSVQSHLESVKSDLLAVPGISAVSFTNCIPTRGMGPTSEVNWEGKDRSQKPLFWCINTDFDYNKTVEVKLTDGRFFNPSFSADSASYLINDVAAKLMNSQNPVGSTMIIEGKKGTIIGTFKDFHAIDLAGPIVPTLMRINGETRPIALIKYSNGNYGELTNKIKDVYHHYDPDAQLQPVLFRDLPSYSQLNLPSNLAGIAFVIALLLACLGFFGLASFTAESRTKEIGIRRTNGATIQSIVGLLLKGYFKWLLLAMTLAIPAAWFLGKIFLGRFHFHTGMPLWAFLVGPLLAASVALLTVLSQTWRSASRNPVEALRYE